MVSRLGSQGLDSEAVAHADRLKSQPGDFEHAVGSNASDTMIHLKCLAQTTPANRSYKMQTAVLFRVVAQSVLVASTRMRPFDERLH